MDVIQSKGREFSVSCDRELDEALEAMQGGCARDVENDDFDKHVNADYRVDILVQGGAEKDSNKDITRFSVPKRITSNSLSRVMAALNTCTTLF